MISIKISPTGECFFLTKWKITIEEVRFIMKKMFLIFGLVMVTGCVWAEDNIAVVDLQKIVSNSSQVRQLKQEHAKKMEELHKVMANSRSAISKENDASKILQLEEKYTNEFNDKKAALDKDYSNRLNAIEKNIKDEIAKKAQADNYDYVFAKSVLLYGGKDITNEIKVK